MTSSSALLRCIRRSLSFLFIIFARFRLRRQLLLCFFPHPALRRYLDRAIRRLGRLPQTRFAVGLPASQIPHHFPSEALKNFKECRRLRVDLPFAEFGADEGALLKWKSDFRSSINCCVILGAASVCSSSNTFNADSSNDLCGREGSDFFHGPTYMIGGLMLKVVFTISAIIVASACHYLLQVCWKNPTELRPSCHTA